MQHEALGVQIFNSNKGVAVQYSSLISEHPLYNEILVVAL